MFILLTVHVRGEQRALQTDTKPNTKDRFGDTSGERQGEPQTHSRQMEEPESPRAAL